MLSTASCAWLLVTGITAPISDSGECCDLPSNWFVSEPISIEKVESDSLAEVAESDGVPAVPFGFINDKWIKFKEGFGPEDEIVHFVSPLHESIGHNFEGYFRVRNDCIQDLLITET